MLKYMLSKHENEVQSQNLQNYDLLRKCKMTSVVNTSEVYNILAHEFSIVLKNTLQDKTGCSS